MSTSNNTTQIPEPTFTPAVPLPVIAPSAEEQKAVRAMSERFSPAAIAARVAAIENEAASREHSSHDCGTF